MSIGLGIFLSTVLLVIVWQIDKRSAWSRLRKSALWIVVIVLLLVLAFVVYSVGDDMLRTRRESEAEKKLAASGVAEYMGVKLGATQAEVKYALGKPDTDDPMGLAKDGTPTYF